MCDIYYPAGQPLFTIFGLPSGLPHRLQGVVQLARTVTSNSSGCGACGRAREGRPRNGKARQPSPGDWPGHRSYPGRGSYRISSDHFSCHLERSARP